MSTKITNTSQRVAEDEGEFDSPVNAAAWVAGAVIAFQDAEEISVDIRKGSARDSSAPASFMWSQPVWFARVRAYWPREVVESESPVWFDMMDVANALRDVQKKGSDLSA